jgi:GAF domain-containing protein
VRLASTLFVSLIWILVTSWVLAAAGISSDTSPLAYPLIIVFAGLLLGGRAAMIFTVLSCLAVLSGYYAEVGGLLVIEDRPLTIMDPVLIVVQLTLTGLLLRYATNSMLDALQRARTNERAQLEANHQLETLRASLEDRVAGRTRDLERRTAQLQAAAEVSRAATSILDPERLMWQVAELLQVRFGLYHVGLFLVDGPAEWAVYRAGAGQAGRELSEQGFRLVVGGSSMVGWCTAHAQTRVAQDVGLDQVHAEHDLVPETRSEAALPLIARGQVIGALSLQSEQPGAFDPPTISALQTIADQVAVALDNARLLLESQEALEATRRAYGELSREAWTQLLGSRPGWGYSYTPQALGPAGGDWRPEMVEAMQTGRTVQSNGGDGFSLAIPLMVRDEVVGVLSFDKDAQQQADARWTPQERQLLERLVHQMGLALESAQFYEETQRRAVRERTARQVTGRIRETLDLETVLKTAAQEARKALGVPEVVVRLRG